MCFLKETFDIKLIKSFFFKGLALDAVQSIRFESSHSSCFTVEEVKHRRALAHKLNRQQAFHCWLLSIPEIKALYSGRHGFHHRFYFGTVTKRQPVDKGKEEINHSLERSSLGAPQFAWFDV